MRRISVDIPVLEKMLQYTIRHLIKDRLFAPTAPNGEPVLSIDSPYATDIKDGEYLSKWIKNSLIPLNGEDRRKNGQMVFDWADKRNS